MPPKRKIIKPKFESESESESESTESTETETESTETETESTETETESTESGEELDSAPEYQYDTENFIDSNVKNCVICGKKQSNKYDLIACRQCFEGISINKTDSKKIYGLTDSELNELSRFEYHFRHGVLYLYFLKDVRLAAIQKKFNIVSPDLYTYINCVNRIYEDNKKETDIKQNKKDLRENLRLDRIRAIGELLEEKNIPIDPYNEEYIKYIKSPNRSLVNTVDRIEKDFKLKKIQNKREKKLRQHMITHGIDIDDWNDICIKSYIIDHEINFDECVKKLKTKHKDYIDRYKKLSKELDKHGLSIRSDSYYCQKYLKHGNFSLSEVVDQMVSMDFFMTKTAYRQIISNTFDRKRQEERDYGDRYAHIDITENDKKQAKQTALKNYLKKNSKKSVPTIVLEKYN